MRRVSLLLALVAATATAQGVKTPRSIPGVFGKKGQALNLLAGGSQGYDVNTGAIQTSSGVPVTFTRASTKRCEDPAATPRIRTVGVNQPCVTSAGLSMEPSATNLLLWSQDLTNAVWTPANLTSAAPTITANAGVAPDGTTTAERVDIPDVTAASAESALMQNFTATATAYSGAIWLKAVSGTPTIYVWLVTGGTGYVGNATACVLSATTWKRCKVENRTLTAASYSLRFGVDLRDTSQAAQFAMSVYAWQGQVELGPVATSDIVTTSVTATRAAEGDSAPAPSSLSTAEGCVCATYTPGWSGTATPTASTLMLVQANTAMTFRPLYVSGTGLFGSYDGTTFCTRASSYTFVAGSKVRVCSRWSASAGKMTITDPNGSSQCAFSAMPASNGSLYFGVNQSSGLQVYGALSDIVLGTSAGACQ